MLRAMFRYFSRTAPSRGIGVSEVTLNIDREQEKMCLTDCLSGLETKHDRLAKRRKLHPAAGGGPFGVFGWGLAMGSRTGHPTIRSALPTLASGLFSSTEDEATAPSRTRCCRQLACFCIANLTNRRVPYSLTSERTHQR